MNSSSNNSRFICRLARRCSVLFGSSETLGEGGWAGRHIEHCADCQAFYAANDEFDALLKADARRSAAAPAGLENAIIAGFRQSSPRQERAIERRRSRSPMFAFAGAAMVAAALAVAFTLSLNKPKPKNDLVESGATPEDVQQTLEAARGASQTLWASVKPSAEVLKEADPLNHELNSVFSDARNAVNFLALNFVPNASGKNSRDESNDSREG